MNGDDVTVYGLFSEHFEGYAVLWNGERGATYFYQNETPYDPITQDANSDDAWLSHNGSVYGYASYKVANSVHTHYAVGLGMYNVFVHTGGGSADTTKYDGGAQIKLRNAVEVPNREGVVIENACLQTFANSGESGGLYQETQHIVNDVGYGVSQGYLRTEARDADGALVGNLLDRNGEELQTRIVRTPYESNGRRRFSYKVYEIDWTGAPIIYDGVEELNLDTLPDDVSWDINTGGFVLIAPWGEVDPSDYRQICGTRPVSEARSRAVRGKGWARTFVTRYCNGAATFSMEQHSPALRNRFVGLETLEGARQLGDDVDYSDLETQYMRAKKAVESHEPKGKRMAAALRGISGSLEQAELYMDEENESYLLTRRYAMQEDVDKLSTELGEAVDALEAEDEEAASSSDAKSTTRKSLAKAHVSAIPVQPWTGEAITPEPAVRLGGRVLVLGTDYTLSYKKNVKTGTAAVIIKGKGNYKGRKKVRFSIVKPSVCYTVHVQDYGPMEWTADGGVSGAAGELRRLEAIKVRLAKQPVAGSIRYRSHVEGFGWEANWSEDGEISGTSGRSKRLEAVQIELTGEMAKHYDVCYSVCEEQQGWMDWVRNGETAGTEGIGHLLEAIRIVIVPKGGSVDLS